MKFLVAVNEFKGSLSSYEIGEIILNKINKSIYNHEVTMEVVADGGDGFLGLFKNFERKQFRTLNAALEEHTVNYLLNNITKEAVIEVAEVIGLKQLSEDQKDPYKTSTVGLGKLISHLLDEHIESFIIGLGGSATNDCGIGMLSELGIKFTSISGEICSHGISDLSKIENINLDNKIQKLSKAKFTIISDVNSPLYGKDGATYIYSKQKGLKEDDFSIVDTYVEKFSEKVSVVVGKDYSSFPGSGAAGGLGYAFLSFLDSTIQSGSSFMINYLDLEKIIQGIDIVITGEGKLDKQSYMGKAPIEIARIAKKSNKKVIFLAGSILDEELKDLSSEDKGLVDASFSIQREFLSLEKAMNKSVAINNIEQTIEQILTILEFSNG